ncbi:MAG: hypothetical protein K1V97_00855 [Lachnospiraceae bacterium]
MTAELRAEIADLQFDLHGNQMLTLRIHGDARPLYEACKDKLLSVKCKIFRKHRSNNANAFCWALCNEIANVLRTDKDTVYLTMLKRYGQSAVVSVRSDIPFGGYLKYYETEGESALHGKPFTHYKVFKGSSEYDTREMSVFLDGIVSEAREMGIPVLSERELSLLKEDWR